jgi:hypothetical protein
MFFYIRLFSSCCPLSCSSSASTTDSIFSFHDSVSVRKFSSSFRTFHLFTTLRNGSDSDLSQLSSLNMNSYHHMNSMQQGLGIILSQSPLVIFIQSLKTNTRDSFDGSSRSAGINITASLENINVSINYKKEFNKTAGEVGEIHLDLLLKVFLPFVCFVFLSCLPAFLFYRLVKNKLNLF